MRWTRGFAPAASGPGTRKASKRAAGSFSITWISSCTSFTHARVSTTSSTNSGVMPVAKTWPIEGYLIDRLSAAIGNAGFAAPGDVRIEIEVPRDPSHGDWASNVALTLAKTARRPPREVAQALAAAIDVDPGVLAAVEVAGAGFLN